MGIFDVFTGDSAKEAASKNSALYAQYAADSGHIFNNALPQELGANTSAIDAYAPLNALGSKYGAATTMYGNALGINGQGGTDAANAAFHSSPGYTFARDQAIDAATRAGNAAGFSGNTIDEVTKRAAGYADQDYGNWRSALGGFVSPELQATGGAATGQAAGYGQRAGLYGQFANDQVGVLGNNASGQANSNTASANAQMQASSQFWNALINGVSSVASAGLGGGKK